MKAAIHSLLLSLLFISISHFATAQNTTGLVLETLVDDIPQLQKKVTFSISNVELYEFLRALGSNNKLNLNIDPTLKEQIAVNFNDVYIKDLLTYLSDQYNLDIFLTGNIISIKRRYVPEIIPVAPPAKKIDIDYIAETSEISFDLQNDTLSKVIKAITNISGYNILAQNDIQNRLINGFVKKMPLEKAIIEITSINNLSASKKDSTTFIIHDANKIIEKNQQENERNEIDGLHLQTNNRDSILSIKAVNVTFKNILSSVAQKLNVNYQLISEMEGKTNLKLENIDFNNFLRLLFNGTTYTYKLNGNVYLIGDKKYEDIHHAEVYKMKHRTLSNVIEKLPTDLKKGVEILALDELNSFVITGSKPAVSDMVLFLEQIDKVIPVINIELIILDIRRTNAITTGIIAGVDNNKNKSSYASIFPSVDISLGSSTINSIIDGINGTGLVNLGKVTPDFYIGLKASEDNGNLKIRSTPRLATLNGKEASMTIGETRYYIEQTTNVITTQSTTTVTGINYKELQANFGINIKPIVSGDEQITLDISVEQSTFTEQASKDGPYGRLTRNFQSAIRVRNNDMILLGGLEEKSNSNAGSGFPILSRIPIIKWLFSSRSQSSKKSKLVILIHPTVFY